MKIQRWPWTFYEVAVWVFFCEYIFSFCWIYFIFPPRKIDKKNARRIHSEFVSRGNTTGYLYNVIALGVLRIYTRSFARIIWRFSLHSEYVFQVHSEKNRGSKNMHAEWKRKLVFMPEPYCMCISLPFVPIPLFTLVKMNSICVCNSYMMQFYHTSVN